MCAAQVMGALNSWRRSEVEKRSRGTQTAASEMFNSPSRHSCNAALAPAQVKHCGDEDGRQASFPILLLAVRQQPLSRVCSERPDALRL
jgi:hypothetical protein